MKSTLFHLSVFFVIVAAINFSGCKKDESLTESLFITAELDTTSATVGDIITYSVSVQNPGRYTVFFPDLHDTLNLEVRNRSQFSDKKFPSIDFQLVPWDTGIFSIPSYPVQFLNPDSTFAFEMATNPLELNVLSVLNPENPEELHPMKEPVPVSPPIAWQFIILISLFIILLISAVYIWKQRIPSIVIPPQIYDSTVPPSTIALEKLDQLDANGDSKKFYVELSYALREFVENSLFIKTLEMTTKEISEYRAWIDVSDDLFTAWIDLLTRADMVKYAKEDSLPKQKTNDLLWSKQFVNQEFKA